MLQDNSRCSCGYLHEMQEAHVYRGQQPKGHLNPLDGQELDTHIEQGSAVLTHAPGWQEVLAQLGRDVCRIAPQQQIPGKHTTNQTWAQHELVACHLRESLRY